MNKQNNSENILEIKNIEVVYDDVILAITDVSLNVPKGSIVAVDKGYNDYEWYNSLIDL